MRFLIAMLALALISAPASAQSCAGGKCQKAIAPIAHAAAGAIVHSAEAFRGRSFHPAKTAVKGVARLVTAPVRLLRHVRKGGCGK